ncbi:MAG: prepilin-type N-terminal cleavage/methylation domain-containing protein [Candidatus Thiodiazotropha sp. (ex Gloverina cf. vestifex)]|nr:prepilin-type N-terminal cleavage/methylation domain-containing protein [Candidatus Thiodiazotropha sp. (ex Gloverina cf. vestifex)]
MYTRRNNLIGYTLVELMITVAILAIVASLAVPIYLGYVSEARLHAVRQNVEPLRLSLEDFFLDNQTYVVGDWVPSGANTLETGALGWRPDGDGDNYSYSVTAGAVPITAGYSLVVTDMNDAAASVTCTRNINTGAFDCI